MNKVSPSAFFSSPVIDLTKSSSDSSIAAAVKSPGSSSSHAKAVVKTARCKFIETIEIASSSDEEIRETNTTSAIAKRRKRESNSSSNAAAVKSDSSSPSRDLVEIIEIASSSEEEEIITATNATKKKRKCTSAKKTSTDRAHVVKHSKKQIKQAKSIKRCERKSGKRAPNKRPIRQYFCPRTNQPFASARELQGDSDCEDTEEWLHALSESLINEFDDVSDKEKMFMNMWNRFIRCQHVIADRDIPPIVETFTKMNRDKLKGADLRLNLLLHLSNLWDCGLISNNRLSTCMAIYDDRKVPITS